MPVKHKKKYRLHPKWMPALFLAPHLIFFCVFSLIPIVTGLYVPFTKWKINSSPVWVGLANFSKIFLDSDSTYFWQFRWGLESTLTWVALVVPLRVVFPLIFAVLLNEHAPGHKIQQSILYIPNLLSITVVMAAWKYLYHPTAGLLNTIFGLGFRSWEKYPLCWLGMLLPTYWWSCGAVMIIFQSALAGVPKELEEAAAVDGANFFQRFIHITIPAIKFPLQYNIISSIAGEFNIWPQSELLNGGGSTIEIVNGVHHQSNTMLMQYITNLGFTGKATNLGIATSMALVMGIIVFAVSMVQFRMMRRDR